MATDSRVLVLAGADERDLTKLAEYEAVGGYAVELGVSDGLRVIARAEDGARAGLAASPFLASPAGGEVRSGWGRRWTASPSC